MTPRTLLDFIFPPQCGGCERIGSGLCDACLPYGPPIERRLRTLNVSALGIYDGALRRAILALKSGRRDVAEAFAERLRSHIPPSAIAVPVPTTAARRRQRGFDGCELIAHTAFGSRVSAGLVQVRGETQRGRGREARLIHRQRFRWRGPQLEGTSIVLLDDVVTTGATLEECARTVRAAGGVVSEALVVASVPKTPRLPPRIHHGA
jgi:predicted amidophosphoribosyltransferase